MPASRFAKLTRPHADGLLRRTRLFEQLDRGCAKPVVWLAAPPGAGKTSLIASWLEDRHIPALWYQLDANDADPATFFHYLREAVDGLQPGRAKPLPAFRTEHLDDLPAFARLVFRATFARLGRGVLVLDNFQEVSETSVLQTALAAGLEEAPEGVHVLVASRTPPPPSLARLRASQKIAFLDWVDVRLTMDEARAIAGAAAERFTEDDFQRVFEQTDGWAAGLVLMLEHMRQTGRVRNNADSANLETIFDYFAAQVFDAAPAPHREMLTRMSYLPQMTAELAQAITGDAGAGQLLNQLARRNLFTDRRLGTDTSYQFHALFRVFLQTRARHDLGLADHVRLTNSAAAMLQTTGQFEEAFALYAQAAEWEPAIRLILKEADRLVQQGRRQTLRQWIQALPMDRFEADPWLSYWFAVSQLGSDYRLAIRLLGRAFDAFEVAADWTGQVLSACRAVDISHATGLSAEEIALWIERLESLLHRADCPDERVRREGVVMLLHACFRYLPFSRRCSDAAAQLEAVLDQCDDDLFVAGASRLQWYWHHHGNRRRAQALVDEGRARLGSPVVRDSTALLWRQSALQHALAIGEIGLATQLAEDTRHLTDDSGCVPDIVEFERLASAILSVTHGETEAVRHLNETVLPRLERASYFTNLYTKHVLALFTFGEGRYEAALAHALDGLALASRVGRTSLGSRFLTTICALSLGASARFDEAWTFAARITEGSDEGHNAALVAMRRDVEIYLLMLQGKRTRALELIPASLSYLRDSGYPRTFAYARRPAAMMLNTALEAGIEADYCRELIRENRYAPPEDAGPAWPWPVRLRVLGGFALEGESVQRRAGGRSANRTLDLLKALIASGAEAVPCTQLADAVWPDAEGDAASRTLEVTVFRLRKLLGREDAVRVRDARVSLDASCCWLDSRAFESLAEEAARLSDDDPRTDTVLASALALYRGHFLSGEPETASLLSAREQLRSRWLGLVRRAVQRASGREAWKEVSTLCRDALTIEPTAEDLLRHRIASLTRLGDRTEALAAYRSGVAQLRLRLGASPAPETEALRESLFAETQLDPSPMGKPSDPFLP